MNSIVIIKVKQSSRRFERLKIWPEQFVLLIRRLNAKNSPTKVDWIIHRLSQKGSSPLSEFINKLPRSKAYQSHEQFGDVNSSSSLPKTIHFSTPLFPIFFLLFSVLRGRFYTWKPSWTFHGSVFMVTPYEASSFSEVLCRLYLVNENLPDAMLKPPFRVLDVMPLPQTISIYTYIYVYTYIY